MRALERAKVTGDRAISMRILEHAKVKGDRAIFMRTSEREGGGRPRYLYENF